MYVFLCFVGTSSTYVVCLSVSLLLDLSVESPVGTSGTYNVCPSVSLLLGLGVESITVRILHLS